jgi:hypothetical protein
MNFKRKSKGKAQNAKGKAGKGRIQQIVDGIGASPFAAYCLQSTGFLTFAFCDLRFAFRLVLA